MLNSTKMERKKDKLLIDKGILWMEDPDSLWIMGYFSILNKECLNPKAVIIFYDLHILYANINLSIAHRINKNKQENHHI